MANTSKPDSHGNADNVMRSIFNPENKSITTDSFIVGKVGHKIERTSPDSVTDNWSYYDGSNLLYTIQVVYTTSAKEVISSVERIA